MPTAVTAREYSAPEPSWLTKKSVYSLAESVAKQISFAEDRDIEKAVSQLGGEILYKDFWDPNLNDSGSLEVDSDGRFRIYISTTTSIRRDKFTIAHELGHYVLHYLWPKKKANKDMPPIRVNRYGSDRIEWEANWFAAAFLMPENEFRAAWDEYNENVSRVAQKFGVSVPAAETRAKALDLK